MYYQLLLLAVAFFGAWLMLLPTDRFIYAKHVVPRERETLLPNLRNVLGLILCTSAILMIFVIEG